VLSAIEEVYHTFYEALALVLAVVILFLGSLRLSLIPMLAIPVSIIGTFFFAKLLGFSVNMPVLFGLVVAIGIVVDDAIVVVENVEAVMNREHLAPKEATIKAMKEVLAPVMSITVVLMAVFVPTAFLPGISGQLFRQFALTIAASTFLSGVCAVTLTPALCGVILKPTRRGTSPSSSSGCSTPRSTRWPERIRALVKFLVHPAVVVFTLLGFGACVVGDPVDVHQGADGLCAARRPRHGHDRRVDAGLRPRRSARSPRLRRWRRFSRKPTACATSRRCPASR
jgi:multidrug efflux pump subunit AcrB